MCENVRGFSCIGIRFLVEWARDENGVTIQPRNSHFALPLAEPVPWLGVGHSLGKLMTQKSKTSIVPTTTSETPQIVDLNHDLALVAGLEALGRDTSLTIKIDLSPCWWGVIAKSAAKRKLSIPAMVNEALEDWAEAEQDNLNKTAAA